ncbi:MAG: arginine repressor, partial [Acidobacteria bacterium]
MTREARRRLIASLVRSEAIGTQAELVAALARRGVRASQASVSRDIRALGLVKIGGRYTVPRRPPAARDPLAERVEEALLSVEAAGPHLLVIRTPAGEA